MVGAGATSFVHTEKTLVDHAVSWATEKDCAALHTANNEPYCQSYPPDPRERLAETAESLHCYRTLGTVTCYEQPDRWASRQTRVEYAHGYRPEAHRAPHHDLGTATLPHSSPAPDGLAHYLRDGGV